MKTEIRLMVMNNENQNRVVKISDTVFMIVDSEDYEVFTHLHCSSVKTQRCTYATVSLIYHGKVKTKMVHRIVARTGPYEITHHRNRNSMDNRFDNLLNMNAKDHDHLHKNDNLIVKFQKFSNDNQKSKFG